MSYPGWPFQRVYNIIFWKYSRCFINTTENALSVMRTLTEVGSTSPNYRSLLDIWLSVRAWSDTHRDEKEWRTYQTSSWFANTNVSSLLYLLVIVKKRGTAYAKWVNRFSYPKRNKSSWLEMEQTPTLILSFSFSVAVLACAFSLAASSQLRFWAPTELSLLFSILLQLP